MSDKLTYVQWILARIGNSEKMRISNLLKLALVVFMATVQTVSAFVPTVQWEKTFGGSEDDIGWSVDKTSDGGFIIAGSTESYGSGNSDVWLIKTNSSGDMQWQQTFGGIDGDSGYCVQETSDSGFVIVGNTIPRKVLLIKTNSSGNLQWQNTFGEDYGDYGYCVQQTSDGGFIITGAAQYIFGGYRDVLLIKTNASGTQQWLKTLGGSDNDSASSVRQTSDGGYVIAASTRSYGAGNNDAWLIKTDISGDIQWQQTFGSSNNDYASAVRATSDGGFIVTGSTESFGAGGSDVWLIKTDSSGTSQWQQTYAVNNNDYGQDIQQTLDGGYIITGYTDDGVSSAIDALLIKTDSSGNQVWQKSFGNDGGGNDRGLSVQQVSSYEYVTAGWTESFSTKQEVYLVKVTALAAHPDIDGDSNVDFVDFARFAAEWMKIGCGQCNGADFTGNGDVGMDDLVVFTDYWLKNTAAAGLPSDDFDDNQMGSLWNLSQDDPAKTALNEINQRLELTSVSSSQGQEALYVSKFSADCSEPFGIKTDFHYEYTGSGDAGVSLCIGSSPQNYICINAGYEDLAYYYYEAIANDQIIDAGGVMRSTADGTLYISYDPDTDTVYVSTTGYGQANAIYSFAGVVAGTWQAATVDVILGGESNGSSLSSGQAYLDNFKADYGAVYFGN